MAKEKAKVAADASGAWFEEDFVLRTLGNFGHDYETALTELVANAWDAGAARVNRAGRHANLFDECNLNLQASGGRQGNDTGGSRMNNYSICLIFLTGLIFSATSVAQTKKVTYYYSDQQGTVLATADESGNIIDQFDHRPFGEEAMAPKTDDPGFTGHVEDTESDFIYMQQRYYDPTVGRFVSVDPAPVDTVKLHNIARYTYANDNPYLFIDPDGREASLYWASPTNVTATIRYSMSGGRLPFDRTAIRLQTESSLSGLVDINGSIVRVTTHLEYTPSLSGQKGIANVNVVKDTNGVTKSGRSETDKIGGNNMTVGATGADAAVESTVAHEFGHIAGAGDQYKGGIDVSGNRLSADVPGGPNIMKVLGDNKANDQTLKEIVNSNTNTNSCAAGIHAASGGC
ncbi:MAG TPA: RHS repeat-associated core domain-containing protein [Luteibacter sp.]|jgi:RHS repeat-associated protein|uniref:RHS repeat-associated core domain-containing protein n=1 Tax=Luteibacter sp. TaxID=1886636 RepID=UPI002F3F098C